MITEVAAEMLTSIGYQVHTASCGQEAIAFYEAAETYPDLVILDLIMPGMSGYATYDRLKQIHPGLKVVLSSGYSMPDEANTIIQQGNSMFIQKPYNLNDLSQLVGKMLAAGRATAAEAAMTAVG
ncbi:response regulator [Desulfatitalea sp. M08but]|uniref:Response regulator n=2 Tax=Desulfatitalea alkaliphila TaxID=2929485 RepID=A0AA41R099_9BACT|nr:response regulator [Desulfatitalea alkaliphila]